MRKFSQWKGSAVSSPLSLLERIVSLCTVRLFVLFNGRRRSGYCERTRTGLLLAELNDDSWHTVRVSVDSRSGRLNVSITGSPDRSVRLVTCAGPPSTKKTTEETEVRRRRREGEVGGGRGQEEHEEGGGTDGRLRMNGLNASSSIDDDDIFITAVISVGGY